MSFESDVRGFTDDTERLAKDIFVQTTVEVLKSIVFGSTLTGSSGQPHDVGTLRAAFLAGAKFTSKDSWETSTKLVYAPGIEAGVGITLRQKGFKRGGFHSAKLTEAGFGRIVDHVTRKLS